MQGNDAPGGVSVAALFIPMLRARVRIVRLALLAALIAAGFALARGRRYTSVVAFMPQSARGGGGASALASQFGISLGGTDATQSPQFYLDLLNSRAILEPLVLTRYRVVRAGAVREATLVDLLDVRRDRPEPLRVAAAARMVQRTMNAAIARTGVLTLSVRADAPDLATQMGEQVVKLLNDFNVHTRQTQAAAERRFAEQRLDEVRGDLRGAENALQSFLLSNRTYELSPTLTFERTRLDRAVSLEQQRYFTLVQSYEQARLEEVRDTPLLTVVEPPSRPVLPDSRGVIRMTLLGSLVGATLGVLLAWARAASAADADARRAAELSQLRRDLATDLRRPWRLLVPSRDRVA